MSGQQPKPQRRPKTPRAARVKFRERGKSITRLEGFSDAVFAFALTLLVVSLEVPKKFSELETQLKGFLPFGICFVLLILIWHGHYVFFRRYGMEDGITILLNSMLLFVVLFFVFPLKFLFSISFSDTSLDFGALSELYTIYGLGFAAIYVIFALFHLNALRQRATLELTEIETFDTWSDVWGNLVVAAVGVGSIVLARFPATIGIAGFFYFMIAIVRTVYESLSGRRRLALERVAAGVASGV